MELNEDGLIPGQPVDFETVMRLIRKPKEPAPVRNEEVAEEKPRRQRKQKISDESEQ